jgi:subtilisin-like proprotein convertase family protein
MQAHRHVHVPLCLALLAAAAAADTWTSSANPVLTVDLATVVLPIEVDGAFAITDVNPIVTLDHQDVSQLRVSLRHPDGTTALLFSGLHGSKVLHACFDDEASALPVSGDPPYIGSWLPAELLSVFQGKPGAGTWELRVEDTVAGRQGTVLSATLGFNGRTFVGLDVPHVISTSTIVNSLLPVDTALDVGDVDLTAWIEHSCPQDMQILLYAPHGEPAEADASVPTCFEPGGFQGTTWDDDALALIELASSPHRGRFNTGSFEPMSLLNGAQPAGDWRLRIGDGEIFDDGVLRAWSIHVSGPDLCSGQQASLTYYGSPLPGTLAAPTVLANSPVLASTLEITVGTSSAVQAEAVLVAGVQPSALPLKGGTLLVDPLVIVPFHIPPLPAWLTHFEAQIPGNTALCGASVYLQVLHEDPGAPHGVALSQGLQITFGD